jgi:hypothetical protein
MLSNIFIKDDKINELLQKWVNDNKFKVKYFE